MDISVSQMFTISARKKNERKVTEGDQEQGNQYIWKQKCLGISGHSKDKEENLDFDE